MSAESGIASAQAGESSALTEFSHGFMDAVEEPLKGVAQLAGSAAHRPAFPVNTKHDSVAHNAGSLLGNAVVFYAAATVCKSLPGALGEAAPIVAGAGIGFIGPVESNSLNDRFKNAVRGAATMTVIEKMPKLLCKSGLSNDFAGKFLNVTLSGAAAGVVDANAQSVFATGNFAGLKTNTTAAVSWGLTGAAFHYGSLGLGRSFQALSDSSNDLLVFAPREGQYTYPLRTFLNSLGTDGIRYRMMDIGKTGAGDDCKPSVWFADGTRVDGSDLGALARKLKLHTSPDYNHYRVAIIGSGPAGVQTAINAASELPQGQHVAMIGEVPGGQARYTSSVKNYMGFPDVTGADLMTRGLSGAKARGAETVINRVVSLEKLEDGRKLLTLRDGSQFTADTVGIATGQTYNQLDVPGIERLENKGVYTLADASDALQLKGKKVFIVGAGNSAGQAAINFSRYASEVHLLARSDDLGKSMSEYLIKEIRQNNRVFVHTNSEVSAVDGAVRLDQVTVRAKEGDGYTRTPMKADAMYVYIGGKPNTKFLEGSGVRLNERGFITTGHDLVDNGEWHAPSRLPLTFETSVPGVFAAGDVNGANPQKRIVSAVGDAGKLIGSLHSYLATTPISESVRITPELDSTAVSWYDRLTIPLTALGGGMLQAAHSQHRY